MRQKNELYFREAAPPKKLVLSEVERIGSNIIVKFVKMKNSKNSKIDVDRKIFEKFGKILREKRKQKNLTQEELADIAGLHCGRSSVVECLPSPPAEVRM